MNYKPLTADELLTCHDTNSMSITRLDVAVVMITTDRTPSYFAQTVRSLYSSEGIDESTGSLTMLRRSGVAVSWFNDTAHNPSHNAARALQWGSEQGRAWVLFIEDDLRFCDRFIDSVAEWLRIRSLNLGFSRYPIALFGSATVDADGNAVYGRSGFLVNTALVPVDTFYGTQAFAIRAGDAAILSEYLSASTNPPGMYDLTIAEWCKSRGVDYLVASIPSFVQHIGEESSIRPSEPHSMFPSWPGEEWSYVGVENTSEAAKQDYEKSYSDLVGEAGAAGMYAEQIEDSEQDLPNIDGATVTLKSKEEATGGRATDGMFYLDGRPFYLPPLESVKVDMSRWTGADESLPADVDGPIDGSGDPLRPGATVTFAPYDPSKPIVDGPSVKPPDVDELAKAESNLSAPVFTTSRRVRAADFRSDWLNQLAGEMEEPVKYHRKLWEYVAIARVYEERIGQIVEHHPGVDVVEAPTGETEFYPRLRHRRPRVLGFGVGRDPLAAWFASRGAEVVATDKPADLTSEDWKSTGQHAAGKDQLRRLNSTTDEDWERIKYAPLDMHEIASYIYPDPYFFDLTFSCGSFEHIGGLQSSLDFFVNQMSCLKPGGVAVHTTEYSVNHNLYDTPGLCLLRRSDITRLAARLAEQGDLLLPFDPDGGDEPADKYIDYPPYPGNQFGPYHLNLALADGNGEYVTTSIVLIAIRGGIRLEKERKERELVGAGATIGRGTKVYLESNQPRKYVEITGTLKPFDSERNPSVLFLGDAVALTGFAKSTHAVCNHLYSHGWNVRVCGMNYYGQLPNESNGQRTYPYPIHPAFDPVSGPGSPDGATLLPRLIYDHKPDIVVIQQDPWNIPTYLNAIDHVFSTVGRQTPPIVGFLAIDSANQSSAIHLNRLAHVATWTQYGADELRKGRYQGPLSIVPLGVDTDTFKPIDRAAIRAEFAANFVGKGAANMAEGIDPSTAFIVGYVGRNQLRKRLDLLIQYFAEFARDRSNTLLYLYVDQATEFDLRSLVHYWGADGKVIVERGDPAHPADDDYMCRLYNLFSVMATCTQGEGWWLPGFEASACGTRIVAPNYSAIRELFYNTAELAPCSHTIVTAPMGAPMYTLGGLADKNHFVNILRAMHDDHVHTASYTSGLDLARKFPWSETGRKFDLMLREVLGF